MSSNRAGHGWGQRKAASAPASGKRQSVRPVGGKVFAGKTVRLYKHHVIGLVIGVYRSIIY
jgi:hypothetical protein